MASRAIMDAIHEETPPPTEAQSQSALLPTDVKLLVFKYVNETDEIEADVVLRHDRAAPEHTARQVSWRGGAYHGVWSSTADGIELRFNARWPNFRQLRTTTVTRSGDNRWSGFDGRNNPVTMTLLSDPWYATSSDNDAEGAWVEVVE